MKPAGRGNLSLERGVANLRWNEDIVRTRNWKKRGSWPAALLVLSAALWGLGLGNGSDGDGPKIPIPQQNFTVTVTDGQGQTLQAKRFTWEGKVYFGARFGNADITLPFQKVKAIRLQPEKKVDNPDMIAAQVELREGEPLDLTMERTSKFYGETRFGTYEIFLKDVSQIVFN